MPQLLGRLSPQSFLRRDGDVALDEHDWHPQTSVMTTRRTYIRGGVVRAISFDVRMYTPAELRALLLGAGFSTVDLLNMEGQPLTADDRRLVAVAHA